MDGKMDGGTAWVAHFSLGEGAAAPLPPSPRRTAPDGCITQRVHSGVTKRIQCRLHYRPLNNDSWYHSRQNAKDRQYECDLQIKKKYYFNHNQLQVGDFLGISSTWPNPNDDADAVTTVWVIRLFATPPPGVAGAVSWRPPTIINPTQLAFSEHRAPCYLMMWPDLVAVTTASIRQLP